MFGAGEAFNELLDRLHAMGAPPPTFGRCAGRHEVYIECVLPTGSTERIGANLDVVAQAIIDLDLTCPDRDREAEEAKLA